MNNPILKVTVTATGQPIEVIRSIVPGVWLDHKNLTDEYTTEELLFPKQEEAKA